MTSRADVADPVVDVAAAHPGGVPIAPATTSADLARPASAAAAAGASDDRVAAALDLARRLSPEVPLPGDGGTARCWEVLATLAAADLTVARAVEPHLDALAILAQAADDPAGPDSGPGLLAEVGADTSSTWGVFAAEAPGLHLHAVRRGERWHLEGDKPWCSLAGSLSHALVTAHLDDGDRGLFAVRLEQDGVAVREARWVARGLADIVSGPVSFSAVAAAPVGGPRWYLERPGFAWGGIGVAACWYGATVALARRVVAHSHQRALDQVGELHLGELDADLHTARLALLHAAGEVDAGRAAGTRGRRLAERTRAVVARVAERTLERAGHALGPGPLTNDEAHARRVADLTVYLRQHHAERDLARLGRLVLEAGDEPGSP